VQAWAPSLSNSVSHSTMGSNACATPAPLPIDAKLAPVPMPGLIVESSETSSRQLKTSSPKQPPSQLPSPVNPNNLSRFLAGYESDLAAYLINGFTEGFKLGCISSPSPGVPRNHKSALEHPDIIKQYIEAGLSKQRIAGPFSVKPFTNFVVSPLGLVPKSNTGKFRVIHDLSFPKSQSVNSNIPRENSAVQYDSIDQVVHLVQKFGQGCLMAKTDIEDAFRIIPIHPSDYYLLGFTWEGKFYYDKCLPMGASSSCKIFETFSTALQWVMENVYHVSGMSHILDDFFFVGPPDSVSCRNDLASFLFLCKSIGVPIKMEKTQAPTTSIVIYGIEVDSTKMECRLPLDKITKISDQLNSFKRRKKVTLRELQSLIGLLNFACSVVVPGRTFLRRLINLTCGITNPKFYIRLNKAARADLDTWALFISQFNGKSVFLDNVWVTSDHLCLYTDASGVLGFAAVLGSQWFACKWPLELEEHHICVKELFPIILALEVWSSHFQNRKVLFLSDNMAVVEAINKKSCRDTPLMRLLRRLVLVSLRFNVHFRAKHIPGKLNITADRLSRFKLQEAFQETPHLHRQQTDIPVDLLYI
jgi:hypothetical protein